MVKEMIEDWAIGSPLRVMSVTICDWSLGDSNHRRWAVRQNQRPLAPHNGWESPTRSVGRPSRRPGSPPRPASSERL